MNAKSIINKISGLSDCVPVFRCLHTAVAEAREAFDARFADVADDAERKIFWDAFRHLYVSGRLIQMGFSRSFVHTLGTAREIPQMFSSPHDANMDCWNNRLGRNFGCASYSPHYLAAAVEQAVRTSTAIVRGHADTRKYEI